MAKLSHLAEILRGTFDSPLNMHTDGLRQIADGLDALDHMLRESAADSPIPLPDRVNPEVARAARAAALSCPGWAEALARLPDAGARFTIISAGDRLVREAASGESNFGGIGLTLLFLAMAHNTARRMRDLTDEELAVTRGLSGDLEPVLRAASEGVFNLIAALTTNKFESFVDTPVRYQRGFTFPYQTVALALARYVRNRRLGREDVFHYLFASFTLVCWGAIYPSAADSVGEDEWVAEAGAIWDPAEEDHAALADVTRNLRALSEEHTALLETHRANDGTWPAVDAANLGANLLRHEDDERVIVGHALLLLAAIHAESLKRAGSRREAAGLREAIGAALRAAGVRKDLKRLNLLTGIASAVLDDVTASPQVSDALAIYVDAPATAGVM